MAQLIKYGDRELDWRWGLNELMRLDCEENLYAFLQHAWPFIDSAPFTPGWVVEALAEHLEAVCDGEIRKLLINIPPRCSKPVAADELVSTQEFGLIPLRDIVPGMHVLTHKNRFRAVTAVHKQGVQKVLRLTSRKGRTVVAAPDHPFYTTDLWRELQFIRAGDRVGVVPQFDHLTSGRPTTSSETARLLGYLIGDGCCQGTPNITVADEQESADIHAVIHAAGFIPTEHAYPTVRRIGIRAVTGTVKRPTKNAIGPVRQFLRHHDLWQKNSYTKRVPQVILQGNEHIVAEFLAAYWACDGFASHRSKDRLDFVIGCTSVSLELMQDIQSLLLRLGIDSTIRRREVAKKTKRQGASYVSYTLTLGDQYNCWQFARRVHMKHAKDTNLTPLRCAAAPDFPRDVVVDIVESVEPAGETECVCLTVQEDQSFVTKGFAVHNSSICSVAFPAWVWAQRYDSPTSGPRVPFLHASYGYNLSIRDSVKCRRLIKSTWYRKLWGDRFDITKEQDQKIRFRNTLDGERLLTSIGSGVTGEGGNIIVVDDPNAADEALSPAIIKTTNEEWWDGTMGTRLNDPKTGAFIVVQQRLGELDLTGHILEREGDEWVKLILPMEYEPKRAADLYPNAIGWKDPRTKENELLWPQRFGKREVDAIARRLSPFRAAGQLQQRPEPAGGGLIKRKDWQLWPPEGEEKDEAGNVIKLAQYPPCDYILASLDTAYTENTMNDPSALTIWGVFSGEMVARDVKVGPQDTMRVYGQTAARVILLYAWQGHLELNALVKQVAMLCGKKRQSDGLGFEVDKLLIEGKASGLSVAQEMRRLFSNQGYAIQIIDPKNTDKIARLYSVQHLFEEQMIYAPDRPYCEMVMDQCGTFPNARHDDLVDTVSMGLRHLRDMGLLTRGPEVTEALDRDLSYGNRNPRPLYPGAR